MDNRINLTQFLFFVLFSVSANAATITYEFSGTVTDAGNIMNVSASFGDSISGEFTYDTATQDSNPDDTAFGIYHNPTQTLKITLPNGSITFGPGLTLWVRQLTSIGISSGMPDPTVSGNFIDFDIDFDELKADSTALSTDELPTTIDINDFNTKTGAFSSFSIENGPAGDPIHFTIDTLNVRPEGVITNLPAFLFLLL